MQPTRPLGSGVSLGTFGPPPPPLLKGRSNKGPRGHLDSPKVANSVKGQGKANNLAKQARRDTTPPAATSGPVSVNCQPVDRGP